MHKSVLLIAAAGLGLTIWASPASVRPASADDVCADLEERVAELEATTVRKGKYGSNLGEGYVFACPQIWVGGGVQLLSLPDIDFTFLTDARGDLVQRQRNSELNDYGGAFVGGFGTPLGYLGGTLVTGGVSGFFTNVDDDEVKRCSSSSKFDCAVANIVNVDTLMPLVPGVLTAPGFTTKTNRDVDYWGVDGELRFGQAPAPLPDSGGYLFRFGYVGFGAGVREINQDNHIRIDVPDIAGNAVNYSETLDTTYWGGFLSIGGEYNILGYLFDAGNLGLRSMLSLRAGIYNAETDYRGLFSVRDFDPTWLRLSDDQVAFIGSATLQTRKQFGPRTSLSLVTDYEYYSYAPEMRYADGVHDTRIGEDDAFEVRTTLRLNIGLGPASHYPPPP